MPFADTSQATKSGDSLGSFVRLTTEHPTDIYILDDEAFIRWTHWLPNALRADRTRRGFGITCPGPRICPVCIKNNEIKLEAGDNYRKHPEYRTSRKRFLTNVLNVTLVKVCSCGAIYFKSSEGWPTECTSSDCKASLVDVKPQKLNRVQILEGGKTLFDQFNVFEGENGITDAEGNHIPLKNYIIRLTTSGEGRTKTTIPVPLLSSLEPPAEEDFILSNGEKQEVIDIANLVKPFTPEEIKHLAEGGSVADIYENQQEGEFDEDYEAPW
jgi:hypothetical protein